MDLLASKYFKYIDVRYGYYAALPLPFRSFNLFYRDIFYNINVSIQILLKSRAAAFYCFAFSPFLWVIRMNFSVVDSLTFLYVLNA